MIRLKSVFFFALSAIIALHQHTNAQSLVLPPSPSFQGLGDLPDGDFTSQGWNISGDGSTVVGFGYSAIGQESIRWTANDGMVGLGQGTGIQNFAYAASTNGSVIVGSLTAPDSSIQAYRWTVAGGTVLLNNPPSAINARIATSVSGDGTTIVGSGISANGTEAYRWTAATGSTGLGDLPGGNFGSTATAISSDGSTIVGAGSVAGGLNAFRWTAQTGMIGLGDFAGGSNSSRSTNTSADGSVIVGYGTISTGRVAMRWTVNTGMVDLGDLPGGVVSGTAWATSADGSVIVGQGAVDIGFHAFIWTQGSGMVDLKEYLVNAGVSGLENWTLNAAYGISADGRSITGFGTNPNGQSEAWIVTNVPEPGTIALAGAALCGMMFAARKSRVHRL